MPGEGPVAVHATAVAIGGRALLIRGASRAGKSRLALALIARSTQARRIVLIGDDRILLRRVGRVLVARPHPRIAGFIECRGLGLVTMPWVGEAPVGGIVELRVRGRDEASPRAGADDTAWIMSPRLRLDDPEEAIRVDRLLQWWSSLGAAPAQHLCGKADGAVRARAKD